MLSLSLFTSDCEGLVSQALLMADFSTAVDVCLHHDKLAEAIILAIAGGSELLKKTQERFFKLQQGNLSRVSLRMKRVIRGRVMRIFRWQYDGLY